MTSEVDKLKAEIKALKKEKECLETDINYIYDFMVSRTIAVDAFENYVYNDPMKRIASYSCGLNDTIERISHNMRKRGLKMYYAESPHLQKLNKIKEDAKLNNGEELDLTELLNKIKEN